MIITIRGHPIYSINDSLRWHQIEKEIDRWLLNVLDDNKWSSINGKVDQIIIIYEDYPLQ